MVVLLLAFVTIKLVPARSGAKLAEGFSDAPFGPFAGYAWIGRVRSISASFTVPRIAVESPTSRAATWIGVQGQGSPARFVQIGAVESRFWSSQEQKTADVYFTFWSDTARHDKAKPLFVVNPGDALAASLTLASGQWTLAIRDNTSKRKARFSIRDEVEGPFNQAEWTQEDPGTANKHVRYPQISAPVFQHLTVNSTAPAPTYPLYSRWMSLGHNTLAPTVVHDDSFTLRPAPTVSETGAQYLRLSAAALDAFQNFQTERSGWTPKTPYTHIASASSQLIEATREGNRALLSARWTRQISRLVRSCTNANMALIERARPPRLLTAASFAGWNSSLTHAAERVFRAGGKLRMTVGLPGLGLAATEQGY